MTEFEPEEGPLLLEELLQDAARQIFEHEDFERFSRWLRDNFDHYVTFELLGESPFDEGFSPEGLQLLAGHLAREIWKYMPLPGNRFRPRPLPKLKPNDPCPCGSGMKYKQCCERLPSDLALPLNAGVIWVTAIPALQELGLLEQAIASHQVPFEGLIEVAVGHFEEAQYRKAAALLEPMLTVAQAPKSTLLHDYALNLLCNCYDALGFNRKKRRLLDTIVQQAPRSELRGAAWQRLATVLADEGDHEAAWQAFKHAQRDTPHSESLGVLEVQLLVSQGRLDEVAPRADFWRRRLLKSGLLPEDPNIRMLEGFADNPLEMMLGMTGSDDLLELLDWMEALQTRPVTPYGYQGMMAEDDEPPGGVLLAPTSLKKVAAAWRRVCPLDKPFGTGPVPVPEQDVWAPEAFERWMKVLRRYPEAWDDLDILDDLAALLMDDQLWGDPAVQQLLEKVLLRARNIVAQSVPEGAGLPWGATENRPALRSLERLAYLFKDTGRAARAEQVVEWLLQLNPSDNHGFRWMLINDYLQTDRNSEALALARRYGDDIGVETRFGAVLALYRLGDLPGAAQTLADALEAFPEVVRYLTLKRIRKPEMREGFFRPGGEDQAWLYREAMRETWAQTEGALEWLKKTAKQQKR